MCLNGRGAWTHRCAYLQSGPPTVWETALIHCFWGITFDDSLNMSDQKASELLENLARFSPSKLEILVNKGNLRVQKQLRRGT